MKRMDFFRIFFLSCAALALALRVVVLLSRSGFLRILFYASMEFFFAFEAGPAHEVWANGFRC